MKPGLALRGFTLIELIITITVMAVLLAIAVPAFNESTLGSKLSSIANSFVASAQLARSEAIKRNVTVTLSAASGGWQNGWVVQEGTTVLFSQAKLPNGFLLSESGGATSIAFQPTGAGATAATLTLCRATPTVGSQKRTIEISLTGRPSVKKEPTSSCS